MMILKFDLLLLMILLVSAVFALRVKDALGAAILLGVFSFMMCLLWSTMGAVDVAFTEAAVGAGVGTVFFVAMIFRTTRRTSD